MFLIVLLFSIHCFSSEAGIKAKVLNCNDGDTCKIKLKTDFELKVRLACLDAPEISKNKNKGQYLGQESKNLLNKLIKSSDVIIEQVDTDRYYRPIVYIYKGSTNINHLLLKRGLAGVYNGRTKYSKTECYSHEILAKAKKIGIWSRADYTSPGEYRKKHKQK